MTRVSYPAVFETDDAGGYGVVFPDLPGCVTQGATLEDAHANAMEALELHLEGMIEDGEGLPDPSPIATVTGDPESQAVTVMLVPAALPGRTRRINVTLDTALISRIDAVSSNRSAFLEQAARAELQRRAASESR